VGKHVTATDAELLASEGPPEVSWLPDILQVTLGYAYVFCLSITWQAAEDISTLEYK